MSNLVVIPNELEGWDVIRERDPQALTNHPSRESAIEAARLRIAEEGHQGDHVIVDEQHVHGLDDSTRGMRTAFLLLVALLLVATIIIAITSLLASWTGV